jgi:hypothetical protein
MPKRTISCSLRPVISWFLNLIEPSDTLVRPQIRSSTVVLPAPFGPMITRSSPLSM